MQFAPGGPSITERVVAVNPESFHQEREISKVRKKVSNCAFLCQSPVPGQEAFQHLGILLLVFLKQLCILDEDTFQVNTMLLLFDLCLFGFQLCTLNPKERERSIQFCRIFPSMILLNEGEGRRRKGRLTYETVLLGEGAEVSLEAIGPLLGALELQPQLCALFKKSLSL